MSVPVVRRAVQQLEADGLLEGHPGKGVFVKATPADLARERQETDALAEQVQALQRDVRELAERADGVQPSDLARGLAELRETVGRIQIDLIGLYQKTGHAYPQGGSNETTQPAPRQGQPER
jgi:DNA-binding GntR family transcriptional regulator